jgi:hypothetical protein
MNYKEPTAKVIDVEISGDTVTMKIEVSQLPLPPLAPGGLYLLNMPEQEVIQLHNLQMQDQNILTYRTYEHKGDLPQLGAEYIYRVWWRPDQLEAVTDTKRNWIYAEYPDNGDHDHCLLTWETIAAYSEHKGGYRSGKDWITEEAYKTYILEDRLRLRQRAGKG